MIRWGYIGCVLALAACGAGRSVQTMYVLNNDPLAPPELEQVALTPPNGWTITPDGSGITDGQFVVAVTTLSSFQMNSTSVLDGVDGRVHELQGQCIVVEYQSDTRLVAWMMLDKTTLTTVQMQSRTPVTFANDHELLLVEIAQSIEVAQQ